MRNQYSLTNRKKGFCLPGGYRYCGPGCSRPGSPINYVDACCKRHDDCVAKFGVCTRCDQALIQCVKAKTKQSTQEGKTARLIANFMKMRTRFSIRPRR
ncbi:Parvovirus coat protein VP1-like protein [Niallia nealsonii]|uniref:Parvovirus coat protein VP1-like protein n=1 Tax=Niallia nealsonii TaxID=115979 RepID=A0A2N0Z2Z4_9BACI|nr:Parvovirus coat protein VP1-like protein [Niallia nealsonii]PKG23880.1 Parvovirus coat protein VP1-like protein [Niallia nealsonii]